MGILFARMAQVGLDEQKLAMLVGPNAGVVNPIGNKRKRYDDDERSPRKKMIRNTENEDEQVSLSPRMNPLQNKTVRVNRYLKHSFSSVASLFKCQLCDRCFPNKDIYLDHMRLCADDYHVSIKIRRPFDD